MKPTSSYSKAHLGSCTSLLTCRAQTRANRSPQTLAHSSPNKKNKHSLHKCFIQPSSVHSGYLTLNGLSCTVLTHLLPPTICLNKEDHFQTHHLHKFPGQLHDGNLTAGPHIVDFPHNPLFQNQQEGVNGVIDEQEMAGFREGSLDGAAAQRNPKLETGFALLCLPLNVQTNSWILNSRFVSKSSNTPTISCSFARGRETSG